MSTMGHNIDDSIGEAVGCEVMPEPLGCLKCPLSLCRYDDPLGYILWKNRTKDRAVLTMVESLQEGGQLKEQAVKDVAQHINVNVRSVYRKIKRAARSYRTRK